MPHKYLVFGNHEANFEFSRHLQWSVLGDALRWRLGQIWGKAACLIGPLSAPSIWELELTAQSSYLNVELQLTVWCQEVSAKGVNRGNWCF